MDTMDVLDAFEIEAITRELDGKIAEETKQIKEYNEYMKYLVDILLEKEYSNELINKTLRNPNPVFKNKIGVESIPEIDIDEITDKKFSNIMKVLVFVILMNIFSCFSLLFGANITVLGTTLILSGPIMIATVATQMHSLNKIKSNNVKMLETLNEQIISDIEAREKLNLINEKPFNLLLKFYNKEKKCRQNVTYMQQQKEFIRRQSSSMTTIDENKSLKKQKNNLTK